VDLLEPFLADADDTLKALGFTHGAGDFKARWEAYLDRYITFLVKA
jgi:hypothetical protein